MQLPSDAGLTPAQAIALIHGDEVVTDVRLELLDSTNTLVADISEDLIIEGSEVGYDSWDSVHGSVQLKLKRALAWGRDRVRPWYRLKTGTQVVQTQLDVGPKPYDEVVLADGPVAYWRLGEASGTTAVDASGNGHDGTYVDGPTLGELGALVADPDTAVDFTSARMSAPGPVHDPAGNTWTWEVWFRPDAGSTSQTDGLIGAQNNPRLCYGHFVVGDTRPSFLAAYTDTGSGTLIGPNLSLGEWHHIVVTLTGADTPAPVGKMYVDGAQVASATFARAVKPPAAQSVYIGYRDTTVGVPGVVDEAAVYDRALTAAEVAEHYDAGKALIRKYETVNVTQDTWAEWPLGVYVMSTPESVAGETPRIYSVEGYGLGEILSHPHGETFHAAGGTSALTAVQGLLSDVGLTSVFSSEGDATNLPHDYIAPLHRGATTLEIINELLRTAGFEDLWFDALGNARSAPITKLTDRAVEWTYDALASDTVVAADRSVLVDLHKVPNRLVAIWDSPYASAVDAVIELTNQSDGITSIDERGLVVTHLARLDATDLAALQAQADALFEELRQPSTEMTLRISPNPMHYHRDVVQLTDTELGISSKMVVRSWQLPLDGSDMTLTLRSIV